MRIPKRITAAWLRKYDACWGQVSLFQNVFPDGVDLTRAALTKAKRKGLKPHWIANLLLPRRVEKENYAKYCADRLTWEAYYCSLPLRWLRAELKKREEKR